VEGREAMRSKEGRVILEMSPEERYEEESGYTERVSSGSLCRTL
jgi:hypothetical protein